MKELLFWMLVATGAFLVLLTAGCTTPDKWSPSSHQEQMRVCSMACGEGRMTAYNAWFGKCECRVQP